MQHRLDLTSIRAVQAKVREQHNHVAACLLVARCAEDCGTRRLPYASPSYYGVEYINASHGVWWRTDPQSNLAVEAKITGWFGQLTSP
jgi:hypothetical protein